MDIQQVQKRTLAFYLPTEVEVKNNATPQLHYTKYVKYVAHACRSPNITKKMLFAQPTRTF